MTDMARITSRARDNLLRLRDVRQRTGMSRTTIYRRIGSGTFPRPVRISAGLVAWYESDVDRWVEAPMDWKDASQNEPGV